MRTIFNLGLASVIAIALTVSPVYLDAQSRRGTESSSSVSRSSGTSSNSSSKSSNSSSSARRTESSLRSSKSSSVNTGTSSKTSEVNSNARRSVTSSARRNEQTASAVHESTSRESISSERTSPTRRGTTSSDNNQSPSRRSGTSDNFSSSQYSFNLTSSNLGSTNRVSTDRGTSNHGAIERGSSVPASSESESSVSRPSEALSEKDFSNGQHSSVSIRNGGGSAVNLDEGNHERQHPRDCGYIRHDVPMHPMCEGPHYFGYRVHYIPHGYVRYTFWGHPYYVYDDIYYRPIDGCFVVCRPPYGVFYRPDVVDAVFSVVRFAYYCNVWHEYNILNSNWRTIEEQNKIIAENNAIISQQNAAISSSSQHFSDESYCLASSLGLIQSYAYANSNYYYEDGVFFIKEINGQYKVIAPPAGALVETLPEDYDVVNLGGHEYYKVDDTIYRMRIVGGKAFFEVLGQLPS